MWRVLHLSLGRILRKIRGLGLETLRRTPSLRQGHLAQSRLYCFALYKRGRVYSLGLLSLFSPPSNAFFPELFALCCLHPQTSSCFPCLAVFSMWSFWLLQTLFFHLLGGLKEMLSLCIVHYAKSPPVSLSRLLFQSFDICGLASSAPILAQRFVSKYGCLNSLNGKPTVIPSA